MKGRGKFERKTSLFSGFIHCLYFIYARNQTAQNLSLVSLRSETNVESLQRSVGNLPIEMYIFYSIAEHFRADNMGTFRNAHSLTQKSHIFCSIAEHYFFLDRAIVGGGVEKFGKAHSFEQNRQNVTLTNKQGFEAYK